MPSRVGSCPSSLAKSFSSPRTLQRVMQKYSGYGEVVTVGDEDEDPQGIEKPRARVVDSNLLQRFRAFTTRCPNTFKQVPIPLAELMRSLLQRLPSTRKVSSRKLLDTYSGTPGVSEQFRRPLPPAVSWRSMLQLHSSFHLNVIP